MPPHEEEPQWPSDDSDTEHMTGTKGEGDGGKTAQLPVPPPQQPQQPQQRQPAFSEAQTVWVRPPQQFPPPRQQQPPPLRHPPQPQPRPIPIAPHAQPMRIEPSGEIHPAEAITDEPPPPATPEPAKPRRRKRRGLIFGGVALVLVIAVGVAAALPYVSNRLGLPWAPNLPKGDSPEPVAVTRALQTPSSSAPAPTSSGVSATLSGPTSNAALGTLTGTVIDPATGSTLWDRNSGQLLTPASTTKLLTTSAALLSLDHGLQLSTKVVAGSSPDTVILVAGGDLTLSSLKDGQDSVFPGAAHLDDLVTQVKQATGGSVKKVQIDLSAYTGNTTAQGWDPGDAPTYAAQIQPAMLDGGLTNPTDDHSVRANDPAGTLLQEFAKRLGATAAGTATAPQGAKTLGEVRSAPLTELIDNLLQLSENTLAEAVGRQTAIGAGSAPSFEGAARATLKVLADNGFDTSGVVLKDNSGLSDLNKVPAKLLAQLLAAAAAPDGKDPRTAKLRPLLEGLPVAGGSGTLAGRYGDASSSKGKGWVRAKTGTLSGVNTLAGVVLDADGRMLVFALMSSGSDQDPGRAALDAVAAALRGCGCR